GTDDMESELAIVPDRSHTGQVSELRIVCFGRFEVWRQHERVELCRNRNGQAIMRYLAGHARHRETVDALADAFWPDDEPDVARHKLQVAVSALRHSLAGSLATGTSASHVV